MYVKQLEDNLRACLNTAIFYSELKNCTVRIQEILMLPESAQFTISNETFEDGWYGMTYIVPDYSSTIFVLLFFCYERGTLGIFHF